MVNQRWAGAVISYFLLVKFLVVSDHRTTTYKYTYGTKTQRCARGGNRRGGITYADRWFGAPPPPLFFFVAIQEEQKRKYTL